MSEFIGRTGSRRAYSYPERRGGGSSPQDFARNFASGPEGQVDIPTTYIEIDFDDIESDGSSGTDVPITTINTGILIISGVVVVKSHNATDTNMTVRVRVDGVDLPVPLNLMSTCIGSGNLAVPFVARTDAISLGLHNVSIGVVADIDDSIRLSTQSCTISIQEVPTATG